MTVGTTMVTLCNAYPRVMVYLRNIGTNTITIVFGNQPVVAGGAGIVLKPNDYIIDGNDQGYECWQGQIQAIGDAVGGTINIYER